VKIGLTSWNNKQRSTGFQMAILDEDATDRAIILHATLKQVGSDHTFLGILVVDVVAFFIVAIYPLNDVIFLLNVRQDLVTAKLRCTFDAAVSIANIPVPIARRTTAFQYEVYELGVLISVACVAINSVARL
jgi:hypothetical protein